MRSLPAAPAPATASPATDMRPSCTVSLDRSLRIVAANDETFRVFRDAVPGDLCGTSFCDLLDPSVRALARAGLERLFDGQNARMRRTPVTLLGRGADVRGHLTATAVVRTAGHVDGVVAVLDPEGGGRSASPTGPSRQLTDMDAKILQGVASGASTVQLAANLFLSRGGVEYHVTSLLRRFKVKNRPALISKAYAQGLFEIGAWPPHVLPDHVQ
ncbi:hypothetical protein Acsp07_27600 [Actinomycetospora sp. NBRC 106378]|jgi:DNA-binding CsgD family transcriptional regulator|nr:hypothetical protein Acsp07_27600 [Actinomycetospora sp. NBRC 106378]